MGESGAKPAGLHETPSRSSGMVLGVLLVALLLWITGLYGPTLATGVLFFGWPLFWGVALTGLLVGVVILVKLLRRGRWLATGIALLAMGPGATLVTTALPVPGDTYVVVKFTMHRPLFSRVASMARQGEFDDAGPVTYAYGADLPFYLCPVSANCNVWTIGENRGHDIYYLPLWIGAIDGDSEGYAHFVGRPDKTAGKYGPTFCPLFPAST